MKTLINAGRDFILNQSTKPIYIDNKPDWVNKETKLANYQGTVTSIAWYEDEYIEGYPTGNAKRLTIGADEVKKLYDAIIQIESIRTTETYYPELGF